MTIDGIGSRSWSQRTTATSRVMADAQTPFARQRRHWAQTDGPGAVVLGQVAPLDPGPPDEQHRVDHLTARDLGRRPAATGRVEQVGNQLPLLIGQGDREGHASTMRPVRVAMGKSPLMATRKSPPLA
jgi:hypothetical protein